MSGNESIFNVYNKIRDIQNLINDFNLENQNLDIEKIQKLEGIQENDYIVDEKRKVNEWIKKYDCEYLFEEVEDKFKKYVVSNYVYADNKDAIEYDTTQFCQERYSNSSIITIINLSDEERSRIIKEEIQKVDLLLNRITDKSNTLFKHLEDLEKTLTLFDNLKEKIKWYNQSPAYNNDSARKKMEKVYKKIDYSYDIMNSYIQTKQIIDKGSSIESFVLSKIHLEKLESEYKDIILDIIKIYSALYYKIYGNIKVMVDIQNSNKREIIQGYRNIENSPIILEEIEKLIAEINAISVEYYKDRGFKIPNEIPNEIILGIANDSAIDNNIKLLLLYNNSDENIRKFQEGYFSRFPLTMELSKGISMITDNKESIRNIIYNTMCQIPPGYMNNILIDSVNAGKYFADFVPLMEKNERIAGKKVLTTKNEIAETLKFLVNDIESITQQKLGYKYDNIIEYNKDNNINIKEPIKLVTIMGFPNGFDKNMLDDLLLIARNGARCGISLLIEDYGYASTSQEKTLINNIYNAIDITLKDNELSVQDYFFHKGYKFSYGEKYFNSTMEKYLDRLIEVKNIEAIKYNEERSDILNLIVDKMNEEEKRSLNFNFLYSSKGSYNASSKLVIPIGVDEQGNVQNITFGVGTSHHGLIAGQTGSGKSTLLHTIISSAINNYTPEELNIYLMDFKEGIEFKTYSKYRIPHIKLIALESQVEFGESILDFMVKELKHRGKLFKSLEVENLKGYKEKTGKDLPRILLIIDEFTNLFNRNNGREITNNNAQLMKTIINQGRAFGINVLMASQTIKDTLDSTLSDEVIEQMAIRIGLKCTPKDSAMLMGHENNELNNIGNEVGMAIYNPENGRGKNNKFKIAYIDADSKDKLLRDIEERYEEEYKNHKCKVFDGNESINIEEDLENPLNLYILPQKSNKYDSAWIGEPVRIGKSVSVDFAQGSNNLMILSRDKEHINRVLIFILVSLIHQKRDGAEKYIKLLDYNSSEQDEDIILDTVFNHSIIERNKTVYSKVIIENLYNTLVERKKENEFTAKPLYLIINGINKARELLQSDNSDRGFSLREKREESLSSKLKELLKDGGDYNIFVIVTCDTYKSITNVNDKLGFKLQDYMTRRIAFNMNGRDGERYINTDHTETLNDNTGIVYDDITGASNKFIIYSEPSLKWINERLNSKESK